MMEEIEIAKDDSYDDHEVFDDKKFHECTRGIIEFHIAELKDRGYMNLNTDKDIKKVIDSEGFAEQCKEAVVEEVEHLIDCFKEDNAERVKFRDETQNTINYYAMKIAMLKKEKEIKLEILGDLCDKAHKN